MPRSGRPLFGLPGTDPDCHHWSDFVVFQVRGSCHHWSLWTFKQGQVGALSDRTHAGTSASRFGRSGDFGWWIRSDDAGDAPINMRWKVWFILVQMFNPMCSSSMAEFMGTDDRVFFMRPGRPGRPVDPVFPWIGL